MSARSSRRCPASIRRRARYLACFAYILSRVARADSEVADAELRLMEQIVAERGSLPPEQAALVVQIATREGLRHGGTEDFIVTREFAGLADREQKLALINCLFAVSAVDQSIRTIEDNAIRQIASELRLEHADFIAARAEHVGASCASCERRKTRSTRFDGSIGSKVRQVRVPAFSGSKVPQ